jgi:small-conductance mechanosensitive channel
LIVPNAYFISETITNWSYRSKRVRLKITVGVAFGNNPREVEAALLEAATNTEGVLKEPTPSVWFTAFGESSLDFKLLVWTTALLHRTSALESEIHFRIHEALTARGIEIPYPQRDLHIRSAPGLEGVLPERTEKGPAKSGEKLKG